MTVIEKQEPQMIIVANNNPKYHWLRNRLYVAMWLLAAVLFLVYQEEDWRGKRAWETYRKEAEARGVVLDWKKFIPPEVPDDQNFAMTPFLKPLAGWKSGPLKVGEGMYKDEIGFSNAFSFAKEFLELAKKPGVRRSNRTINFEAFLAYLHNPNLEVFDSKNSPPLSREQAARDFLDELKPFLPIIEELRVASRLKHSRFNLKYDSPIPGAIMTPHVSVLRNLSSLLEFKTSAELTLGDSAAAFDDWDLMLRLADSIETEPILTSELMRIGYYNAFIIRSIQEGLAGHRWSDQQLQHIQFELHRRDFLTDIQLKMAVERASSVTLFESLRSSSSRMWGFF